MRSNEEIKEELWYVIQKIKMNCIQHNLNIPIQYIVNLMESHDEMEILKELGEIGAITITKRHLMKDLFVSVTISIRPAFLQILEKPQEARSADASLNMEPDYKKINELFRRVKGKAPSDQQQRLPLLGEIVVSGLKEGLKALQPKSPEYSRPKFPYKIPSGTEWENITIKFLDDEQIVIILKGLKHVTNFIEMGMVGKGKVPKPSEQWSFLKVLAKLNGELTIKDSEAKDIYKKHKAGLSKTLREYFSIDYDPFHPYHSTKEKIGNSYKIKITLIPPPERTTYKEKIHQDETDQLGIREYLTEIAPHI